MKTKPKTPSEWAALRCQISCKIGTDELNKKTYADDPMAFALYNLIHAVNDLSKQVEELGKRK
ncbi:hypothetical protein UFOVP1444_40 [uncultured Caudovirales phage]|uniref:Uncharacterized protein n=1 Tax=uncultured Caudovirales phage TaxID=2100421 RepID=A0A6J5SG00_9CAUD|nr:hypothetical protein UFOVP1444_40 [uncultured Caudovirales phage]CAB5227987.1 hypothetical protein UFOVP1536_28 [uncultured Caudovirales phage]